MRKAYGFRTFRITEIALYHALGKLPEPHGAHRFYSRTQKFRKTVPASNLGLRPDHKIVG
jgi:hypothetical protein